MLCQKLRVTFCIYHHYRSCRNVYFIEYIFKSSSQMLYQDKIDSVLTYIFIHHYRDFESYFVCFSTISLALSFACTDTHKLLLQMGLLHYLVHFPVLYPAEIQFHKTCSIDCNLYRMQIYLFKKIFQVLYVKLFGCCVWSSEIPLKTKPLDYSSAFCMYMKMKTENYFSKCKIALFMWK